MTSEGMLSKVTLGECSKYLRDSLHLPYQRCHQLIEQLSPQISQLKDKHPMVPWRHCAIRVVKAYLRENDIPFGDAVGPRKARRPAHA